MIKKPICFIILTLLVIGSNSVAQFLEVEKETKDVSELSNQEIIIKNECVSASFDLPENCLDGTDYYDKEGEVKDLGGGVVRISEGDASGQVWYIIQHECIKNELNKLEIGVDYKDTSAIGNGPTIKIKNQVSGVWEIIEKDIGKRDEYKFVWFNMVNPNRYVSGNGKVDFSVEAWKHDDTFVRQVCIRYECEDVALQISPPNNFFGEIVVGEESEPFRFTLENIGQKTVTGIVDLDDDTHFEIISGDGTFVLSIGKTKTIEVIFGPASEGRKSTYLIAHGDNCNDAEATLSGKGIPPGDDDDDDDDDCCFPAGTKIIMTDGSYKNIENVKIGDSVLSYDIKSQDFESWTVIFLSRPVRPIYEINNGLINTTSDHPFYIKKQDGRTGWGAVNPKAEACRLKGEGLSMEIGDKLLTSNEEWIEIENITYCLNPVQTYNILSFTGKNTYFANGILVYEEFPKWTELFKTVLKQKHPIWYLVQILLEGKIQFLPFYP